MSEMGYKPDVLGQDSGPYLRRKTTYAKAGTPYVCVHGLLPDIPGRV